jgi:hypothetical protein
MAFKRKPYFTEQPTDPGDEDTCFACHDGKPECPKCKGTGKVTEDGKQYCCRTCDGEGYFCDHKGMKERIL